jgi:hypothetical protein
MRNSRSTCHAGGASWSRWLAATALAGSVGAQVPAHATALNPTKSFQTPLQFLQHGDFVHAFANNGHAVYHARSADGGRTWPVRERVVGTFWLGGILASHRVLLAVQMPGQLLVLANDAVLGPGIVRSFDDGATWTPTTTVASVFAQQQNVRSGLHVDGTTVVVAWNDDRPAGRVFVNRSNDAGSTWQPADTPLDLGIAPGSWGVNRVLVAGSGAHVHVLWHDGAVRRQRSTDGGLTWLPSAVGLTGVALLAHELPETLLANGSTLLLRAGESLLRSTDAGDTWTVVTNHGVPRVNDVAAAGNLVVVTGNDNPQVVLTHFVDVSSDGGATWRPAPLQLPGASFLLLTPRASVDDGAVYVNWEIPGWPGNVIRSGDGGATWHVIEGPVQSGFSPGSVRTIHTARSVLGTGHTLHHAYVGVGSTRLGTATPGTGGIAPRLTSAGLPLRGGATTLRVDGAVGGAQGVLAVSFDAPVAVPVGSATFHLAEVDVPIGFTTSAASGTPGAGTFALPVAVPTGTALVGASVVAQALVLDAGAGDGFTVTNALELWLR